MLQLCRGKAHCAAPAPGEHEGCVVTIRLYGIRNCDTMKKARAWLDKHDVVYEFHDYKQAGVDRADLERWCAAVGWEALLNRRGTTFRKLPQSERARLDERRAIELMLAQPSMIRRPVLTNGRRVLVGFSAESYAPLAGSGSSA